MAKSPLIPWEQLEKIYKIGQKYQEEQRKLAPPPQEYDIPLIPQPTMQSYQLPTPTRQYASPIGPQMPSAQPQKPLTPQPSKASVAVDNIANELWKGVKSIPRAFQGVAQIPQAMSYYGHEGGKKDGIKGVVKGWGEGIAKSLDVNRPAVDNWDIVRQLAPDATSKLQEKSPFLHNLAESSLNIIDVTDLTGIGLAGDIAKGIGAKGDIARSLRLVKPTNTTEALREIGDIQKEWLKKIPKPVQDMAEEVTEQAPKNVKAKSLTGKYKVKNTQLDDAINRYNESIEAIQNYFGTNELRVDEMKRIQPELGIDLNKLVDDIEKAQQLKPRDILNRAEMATKAGMASDETYDLMKRIEPKKLTPSFPNSAVKESLTPKLSVVDEVASTASKIEPEQPISKFTQTVKDSKRVSTDLQSLIEKNPQYYNVATDKDAINAAKQILDNTDIDTIRRSILDSKQFASKTEVAVATEAIDKLQQLGRYDDALDVLNKTSRELTRSGQIIQAATLWNKQTPQGMTRFYQRTFEEANKYLPDTQKLKMTPDLTKQIKSDMDLIQAMGKPDEFVNFISKQLGERNIKVSNKTLQNLSKYSDDRLKSIAVQQLMGKAIDQVPASAARKISTVQAMSHLFNGKTMLRNIFSNTTFGIMETISNTLSIPFDWLMSLKTGKRYVGLPTPKGSFKAGMERAKDSAMAIKLGINNVSGELGKYDLYSGRTFKKGPLASIEKGMSYGLTSTDEFYKGFRETQTLNQLMKMSGTDKPTQEMLKQAAYEAKYATFQDDSLPAAILQSVKDVANMIGVGKTTKTIKGAPVKEFGLGDFVIKYAKVPGNLISRGIEYTPAGALRALSLMKDAKGAAIPQREIALTLGRALTGSAMIGLGVWLHDNGLLVGEDKDADKNVSALDRAEGLGNYKVNVSAIERALSGNDAKPQSGDRLYSYNWNEPLNFALAIGGAIASERKKEDISTPDLLQAIGSRSMEEVLDLPTMYIINKMMYEGLSEDSNVFTILSVPMTEALPGFVPAPVRQFAQYQDPIARDTKGDNVFDESINRIKSNIPGLRQSLSPRIAPFGDEIKYDNSLLDAMVNPALKSTYNPNPLTPQLKELSEQTGRTDMFPKAKAPNSINLSLGKFTLSPQDKVQYQQRAGQATETLYNRFMENEKFNQLTPDKKADFMSNYASQIRTYARDEIIIKQLENGETENESLNLMYSRLSQNPDFAAMNASEKVNILRKIIQKTSK